ncbi:MAG: alpha/beta hydrolase [Flavobacterium sp.]|nr:MAG: alpha/beta hydrolase [Flavobacterium sp.]
MIKYLQYILPNVIASKIYDYISCPRIRKVQKKEEEVLRLATSEIIDYANFSLMRYEWGKENDQTAFLVHGWEGHSGNFASLIPVLLDHNFRVISIDAPSHGMSSTGKTNMFELSNILSSHFIKEQPDLVISHSFGSVSVGNVLKRHPAIKVRMWLMVTTPNSYKDFIDAIALKYGLGKKVVQKLVAKIEEDVNENIDDLNMVVYCNSIKNVERGLIVHSKSDKVLPIDGARAVHKAFDASEMIELDGYGHYSILWAEELINALNIRLSKYHTHLELHRE